MPWKPPTLPPFPPPWYQFQIWWQQVVTSLEQQLTDITTVQADILANQADIIAAQADADQALADAVTAYNAATAAQSTANTANTTATTVKRDDAISASWTSPGAILSASDAGSSATITIANHSRKYGDGTSLSITGDTITGRAYSTTYYVYYNDASRSDTTPNFLSTTNPNTAAPNAANGRHFCGAITTPAMGGGSTSGGTEPPGGDYGGPASIP